MLSFRTSGANFMFEYRMHLIAFFLFSTDDLIIMYWVLRNWDATHKLEFSLFPLSLPVG